MPFQQIQLGEMPVDVIHKDIKNIHLSVHPPIGRVTVAAPFRMDLDTIRIFVITKIGWIRRQQKKFQDQEREAPREFIERESHYIWGKRYLLHVAEADSPPSIQLRHKRMLLQVRPGTTKKKCRAMVEEWYRSEVRKAVFPIVECWQNRLGVQVNRIFVQRMKTKWGSCNPSTHSIRLNTDLAKKPPECLEYIVIHEMMHMLEPSHNARFQSLMDQHYPQWRSCRQTLNRLPVSHEHWVY